jgi:hypothetical protein
VVTAVIVSALSSEVPLAKSGPARIEPE